MAFRELRQILFDEADCAKVHQLQARVPDVQEIWMLGFVDKD